MGRSNQPKPKWVGLDFANPHKSMKLCNSTTCLYLGGLGHEKFWAHPGKPNSNVKLFNFSVFYLREGKVDSQLQ